MKSLLRVMVLSAFAVVFGLMSAGTAMAQTPETSFLRVTEPLDVGGTVLQPGVYVIRVLPLTGRDMLQVTNEDRSKVYTTVLSIPHALPATAEQGNTEYVLYPATEGAPRALRTWFAPNSTSGGGHDIVYPQRRAMELAALAKEPVVAYKDETKPDDLKIAALEVVSPDNAVGPYIVEEPMPKTRAMTSAMPQTASRLPLFAMLGLLMIGAAIGIRVVRSV